MVKGAAKMSNLLFKIAAKWVEKWCCAFHHSLINSVLISFLQLLQLARICCWESRAKLYFWSKNSTCCKCILPVNLPIPCIVCHIILLQQSDLLGDRFDSWMVKCATSSFNSFFSNVARQVAPFCCLLYFSLLCFSKTREL